MAFEGLAPVPDVSVGDWLEPRMCGFGGRVCSVVPTAGFEAFARILHPPHDGDELVTWAEVCRRLGRTAHPLMQWRSIAGVRQVDVDEGRWPRRRRYTTSTSEWPGGGPDEGNLPPDALAALIGVLAAHTAADDCLHAVWEGWGWLDGQGVAFLSSAAGPPPPPVPPGVPAEFLATPRMRLPGRDYVLFRGPLGAALGIGHTLPGSTHLWPQSPNLMWPADHAWCVASEIDFDSTLVAGSRVLVDAVLAAPGLEAWPVGPEDDLTYGGDPVNG